MCNTSSDQNASIDLQTVRLQRGSRGELRLQCDASSEPFEDVRVARCFPWSLHERYVSIRDKDGNELVLFHELDQADLETQRLIQEELDVQEFVPRITSIQSVDDRFDVMAWQVQTDRGPIELQVKSRDDIRELDDQRILIKDHAGGLFEIADVSALDPRSQRFVEDHMG